ncbi:MAG: hypothetical protein QW728_01185, partial [Thermoplasmata archaeon]
MVSAVTLRYSGEWFDIFVGFLIFLIVLTILTILTAGIACCWLLFALILTAVFAAIANAAYSEKQRASPQ